MDVDFDESAAAGVYPLVRSVFEGDRWRVYVTVASVGAAAGVVRVAEAGAALIRWDLVEVDRSEGRRTADGIEYVFDFDTFDNRNAAMGVSVDELHPGGFRCGSPRHGDTEVPASVRVVAPVPGERERVSVMRCGECWAGAVVDGLGLDQYVTGE